jgi:hypothetical protein
MPGRSGYSPSRTIANANTAAISSASATVSCSRQADLLGLRRASSRREHELMKKLRLSISLNPIESSWEREVNSAARTDPGNWRDFGRKDY